MSMFNLGYKNWLLPYVEGSLDDHRRAILEERLKSDRRLAAEYESLRLMITQLRGSAVSGAGRSDDEAYDLADRRSIWPRVEAAITPRRPVAIYGPRLAMGGVGIAAVALGFVYLPSLIQTPPKTVAVVIGGGGVHSTVTIVPNQDVNKIAGSPSGVHNKIASNPPTAPLPAGDGTLSSHTGRYETMPQVAPILAGFKVDKRHHNTVGGAMMVYHAPSIVPARATDNPAVPPIEADGPPPPPVPEIRDTVVASSTAGEAVLRDSSVYSPLSLASTMASPDRFAFARPMIPGQRNGSSKAVMPVQSMSTKTVVLTSPIETLRNKALKILGRPVEQVLVDWRDALELSVVPTEPQTPDTSAQLDETIEMVRSAGLLPPLQAMMQSEHDVASWRICAHIYALIGQPETGVSAWRHIIDSGNATAEDWYQLGRAHEVVGNAQDARIAYQNVMFLPDTGRAADANARLSALGN